MRFDVITLFPSMFAAVVEHGITHRAHELRLWSLATWNPRDFVDDAHRTIDDRPFGGGPGMVMMAPPLAAAVAAIKAAGGGAKVLALAPNGVPLTDAHVRRYAQAGDSLALVCGRYEGIDQRFIDACVDEVVSIGDFVLSGGEIAAMALIDAVVRQLPGALKDASTADESFVAGLLDAKHYTRPESWRGVDVPQVLLSGHHAQIAAWRRREALSLTATRRPDLIDRARATGRLTAADERQLREPAPIVDPPDEAAPLKSTIV
ncbi:MAG TPA: tRNA (guanosine(37)-N1)-methyltransferase TrmD [Burkholderiaceae bacterium]|nr:tRNA (guanosine(37)-N1)-methyltransferase TrmD [Burkholderiaceae bacterium]